MPSDARYVAPMLGHGRSREHRTWSVGPAYEPFRPAELGVGTGPAADELHRSARPSLLVVEQPGAGGDQRVEPRPVTVLGMVSVPGDGARDEPLVGPRQRVVVDARAAPRCPARSSARPRRPRRQGRGRRRGHPRTEGPGGRCACPGSTPDNPADRRTDRRRAARSGSRGRRCRPGTSWSWDQRCPMRGRAPEVPHRRQPRDPLGLPVTFFQNLAVTMEVASMASREPAPVGG